MNIRHIRYFVAQAFGNVVGSPVVQLVAISTISMSLVVLCTLLTATTNLDQLTERWGRGLGIVAFLKDDVQSTQGAASADRIRAWGEVASVVYRSRADALTDLRGALADDADLLEGIDETILPATLEVTLKPASRSEVARAEIAKRMEGMAALTRVQKIDFGQDMMTRIRGARELVRVGGFVVGLLVLFAVVFIITNTVRLTLFARREEIEVMSLVGATNTFIRVPFYLEGAFQGGVSASLALALTWVGARLFPMASLFGDLATAVPYLKFLSLTTMVIIVSGAAFVGIFASHLATGRFLRGHRE
jgi:cell division transport system permease protein